MLFEVASLERSEDTVQEACLRHLAASVRATHKIYHFAGGFDAELSALFDKVLHLSVTQLACTACSPSSLSIGSIAPTLLTVCLPALYLADSEPPMLLPALKVLLVQQSQNTLGCSTDAVAALRAPCAERLASACNTMSNV